MSRDITPFGLRMPAELKQRIDEAARSSSRSINAEVIDRLHRSFEAMPVADLSGIPDGVLLDEVIARYGARQVHIEVAPSATADVGSKKPRKQAK